MCSWAGSEVLEPLSKRDRKSTLLHLLIQRLSGAELVRMQVPVGSRLVLALAFVLVWGSSVQGKRPRIFNSLL